MIPRFLLPILLLALSGAEGLPAAPDPDLGADYTQRVRPIVAKYCLNCHSTEKKKGDLDLERFAGLAEIRRDLKPWSLVIENLENGEMPPKKSTPLPAEERKTIVAWTREMIAVEAKARAGDPGRVVIRRLSNAEYNNTIRDLTGVDLEPARDFPADGAAGEGFTNAGDALVLSPTLLQKYLAASKEIAARLVLLPDGFRFSPSKNQRDWTDESLVALRNFFSTISADGKLPLKPYLAATIAHRDELAAGKMDEVAAKTKLSPKYLGILWTALSDPTPSYPLDVIRVKWKTAAAKDVDGLIADIGRLQAALWRTVKIGSYGGGKTLRQEAANPNFDATQKLRFAWKPVPGESDVQITLSSAEWSGAAEPGNVVWKQPRFVKAKSPDLLLKDYAQYGPALELDVKAIYADIAEVLAAVAGGDPGKLDPAWVKRWSDFVALKPAAAASAQELDPARMLPATPLTLLSVVAPASPKTPSVHGWHSPSGELPAVLSNSSDKEEHIPGRANPHKVQVHPTPDKVAAIAWKSPVEGRVHIEARIQQVHGCGNGVAWWLEARRGERGLPLGEGVVGVVQEKTAPPQDVTLQKGDLVVLAIDPRDNDHICDLTEVSLVVKDAQGGVWDLAKDVADSIGAGNPHADAKGNADVWQFCEAPLRKRSNSGSFAMKVPPGSKLDEWRQAPSPENAAKVQALLTGPRPTADKSPDRILYDLLVTVESPLLQGIDLSRVARPKGPYGLELAAADLELPAGRSISFRVPAGLMKDHEFVVEAVPAPGADRVLQCSLGAPSPVIDVRSACIASPTASKRLLDGLDAFRRVFPQVICFPHIVPEDEVVCLKLFHREDALLSQLFLDDAQNARLEKLWEEQKFISQWPVTEHKNLPLFIGFVTQDGGKEAVAYFESLREPFRKRAEAFEAEVKSREPAQIEALLRFAERAYRRPPTETELAQLQTLYKALREKEMSHLDAMRGVLTRILVSASFLFKLETAAPGHDAQPVSDPELATRLSYFLWASLPDAELQQAKLHEPAVMEAQVRRLLKDPRARGLAVEFATQWLHVRAFRQNREKNEKLFPTFDDSLRDALFEEPVLFFMELLRADRPAHDLIDADFTFLNEKLAKHYGIPGVSGSQWRRVDAVHKYGRGGILALGSVLAQESGASRTSPVLRGNWLVETLLGEKLPKPPANVPRLPEDEVAADATVREITARHTRVPECQACHVRIDPFGFAMEKFDPIGRFRDKDAAGRAVDVAVELKDGTRFEGLDGLRAYLLEKRRRDFETTFCRKLLGYALGRSTTLSDQPLIDAMVDGLEKGGPLSGAVLAVAQSRQFRYHRGLEATKEE